MQSNSDDIFFKDIVSKVADREIQYIFLSDSPAMSEKLLVFLLRHGKILQGQADLFDLGSKGVARVRLSGFSKKGYTRSRSVDISGFRKTGVSKKGRRATVHILTGKGLNKAIEVMKRFFDELLKSPLGKEILVDLKRIDVPYESFWENERVLSFFENSLDVMKRAIRLHDITERTAYVTLLSNTKESLLTSFSIEQRYNISGECFDRAMSIKPVDLAKMCRSDMYFRFEAAGVSAEYILEHDMCSEKPEDLGKKLMQYSTYLLSPRLQNHIAMPVIMFSISTIIADRESGDKTSLDQAAMFIRSSNSRLYAGMCSVVSHLIAENLSDESMSVAIDDPLMTLGLVRRIVGRYGDSPYLSFLDRCTEIWGDDVPFAEVSERFNTGKLQMLAKKKGSGPRANLSLIKRRRQVYDLLFENEDYKFYFRSGLSFFCTSIDRIQGALCSSSLLSFFGSNIQTFLSGTSDKDITVSGVRGGRSFGLEKGGGRIHFPYVYAARSVQLPFVVENISSDIGALFRIKELTETPSSSLPFTLILVYNVADIAEMDYLHRGVIKSFLRYTHSSKIPVHTCCYGLDGVKISYGQILNDQNALYGFVK
jgi:hypothetical protein